MKILVMKSVATLVALFSMTVLFAQPPAPPATPIDGGLGILLAGGAAYALKKLRDHKKTH